MNEPRWLDGDEATPELRELLSLAEAPRPLDAGTRERSRQRVIALAAVPAAAGVMFWVQHFALGALLGGAVSVGVAAGSGTFSFDERTEPALNASPQPVKRIPAGAPRPTAEPGELMPPAARSLAPPAAPAATATPPLSDGGVAGEVRLLEAARRALATEPARALALLERHEREFPAGVLGVEREFLAIDALTRSGRRPEAEERARRLRQRVPGSLYEERVGRILEKGE